MLTATVTYNMITKNLTKSLSTTASKTVVKRESEYYLANIGKVKTIDEFLKNDRLYRYAMKAHGLEDMAYAKGLMRKVLEGGVTAKDSMANKLSDTRYKDFATTFNFQQFGKTATTFTAAQQDTVDKYVRQTMEEDVGSQNEGARLALYFTRKASGIKDMKGILGDAALLKVVQTTFNIPAASGNMSIEAQEKMLGKFLKVEDLKDATKVAKLMKRFTATWEAQNSTSTGYANAALLIGQSTGLTVSADVLTSLQNLRMGGN